MESVLSQLSGKAGEDAYVSTLADVVLHAELDRGHGKAKNNNQDVKPRRESVEVLTGLRANADKHVLLLGKPGSGKSTALKRLLREDAEKCLLNPELKIPVLLELRRLSANTSIESLLATALSVRCYRVTPENITDLLDGDDFFLLLDGLNELPSGSELYDWRKDFSYVPMIFTSRELGVDSYFDIDTRLSMLPLTEEQKKDFIKKRLGNDLALGMLRSLQGRIKELTDRPLLLDMLCDTYQSLGNIPHNQGELFRQFTHERYEKHKPKDMLTPRHNEFFDFRDEVFQEIAFYMMDADGDGKNLWLQVKPTDIEKRLEKYFREKGSSDAPSKVKQWLDDSLNFHLLQRAADKDKIEFSHQLFQEYYAAEWLLRHLGDLSDDQLCAHFLNSIKWTESILMLVGLSDDSEKNRLLRLSKIVDDEINRHIEITHQYIEVFPDKACDADKQSTDFAESKAVSDEYTDILDDLLPWSNENIDNDIPAFKAPIKKANVYDYDGSFLSCESISRLHEDICYLAPGFRANFKEKNGMVFFENPTYIYAFNERIAKKRRIGDSSFVKECDIRDLSKEFRVLITSFLADIDFSTILSKALNSADGERRWSAVNIIKKIKFFNCCHEYIKGDLLVPTLIEWIKNEPVIRHIEDGEYESGASVYDLAYCLVEINSKKSIEAFVEMLKTCDFGSGFEQEDLEDICAAFENIKDKRWLDLVLDLLTFPASYNYYVYESALDVISRIGELKHIENIKLFELNKEYEASAYIRILHNRHGYYSYEWFEKSEDIPRYSSIKEANMIGTTINFNAPINQYGNGTLIGDVTNNNYEEKCQAESRPLILTEGKTDPIHLEYALKRLQKAVKFTNLKIEFASTKAEGKEGATETMRRCTDASIIFPNRIIIGLFDRDNKKSIPELKDKEIHPLHNLHPVYIAKIPQIKELPDDIAIENYYSQTDLERTNTDGRKLKIEDGYKIKSPKTGENRQFLSKKDFAENVINEREGFKDIDVSNFAKIFELIETIIAEAKKPR